jgi:hypothetical protein
MAKPAKKSVDDKLFERMPAHLKKLNGSARKGLREDERQRWKESHAHDGTDQSGIGPAR